MKKRVLVSAIVFSIFSLFGPLIHATCLPAYDPWRGYGYMGSQVFDVVILTWPTFLFSVGEPAHASLSLIDANVVFFATFGALIGILGKRTTGLVAIYVATCVLLSGLESWFYGFHFAHLNWLALGSAFLLYAVPFGIVFRCVQRNSNT